MRCVKKGVFIHIRTSPFLGDVGRHNSTDIASAFSRIVTFYPLPPSKNKENKTCNYLATSVTLRSHIEKMSSPHIVSGLLRHSWVLGPTFFTW
jgi:hypothetical protein